MCIRDSSLAYRPYPASVRSCTQSFREPRSRNSGVKTGGSNLAFIGSMPDNALKPGCKTLYASSTTISTSLYNYLRLSLRLVLQLSMSLFAC